jgi:hypothetical protein
VKKLAAVVVVAGGALMVTPAVGATTHGAVAYTPRLGVAGRAARLLGPEYAGTRTTRSGNVLVEVKAGSQIAPGVLGGLPKRVQVRHVPLGQRTLRRAQNRTTRTLDRAAYQGAAQIYSNERRGSIVVAAKRVGPGLRDALKAAASPAKLVVRRGSIKLRAQYPPHQGGLRIAIGNFLCTSGFDVTNGATTASLGLTAGHCGHYPENVYSRGLRVGYIRGSTFAKYRTPTDSAVYTVPAKYQTAKVFTGTASKPVRDYFADSAFHAGMQICFYGYHSARQVCGQIYNGDTTVYTREGNIYDHQVCMYGRSLGGDSGGPIYKPTLNGGVIAAGLLSNGGYHLGRADTCFAKIARTLAYWNLYIWTR